uniref:chitinase n=1 Tax=Paenibacillus sp. FPU-7 TaxID=762821 RepID=K7ZNA8_9BACL|nr:chitinase [Paenibacillus sp. FPU-7]
MFNLKRRTAAKRALFTLLSFIVALSAFLGLPSAPTVGAAASTPAAAPSYNVVGYFTSWGIYDPNFQVTDLNASKLTHLNYAFADICWNGRHGNSSPESPNKTTWSCTDSHVPLQKGSVPNGTIVLGEPWADVNNSDPAPGVEWEDCDTKALCGNFYALKKLKAANPHLKTLISVGGWTWSNRFSDVAADAATRAVFAKSAVTFLRTYGFDGVDLDWEYPVEGGLGGNSARPADKQNYTLLLQEIRKELNAAGAADGKTYLLTIASGASQKFVTNTEIDKIAQIVDWINIMTYDFHGDWEKRTNNNAPLYADTRDPDLDKKFYTDGAIQIYKNAGVPGNKLTLGLPFYGRGWTNCAPGAAGDGLYQECTPDWNGNYVPRGTWDTFETGNSGFFDYGDLGGNYVNKNGYTRYWNDQAKVPYLYNPTTKTFISYDDEQSIKFKTDYIKSQGLAGAMVWDTSSDCRKSPKYTCTGATLLEKIASELGGTGGGTPDTTAPSVPANVQLVSKTDKTVSLRWDASTDNVGVVGYDVYQGAALAGTTAQTTFTISGLTPETTYSFTVKAKDAAGNISAAGSALQVTTSKTGSEQLPPTAPANLTTTAKTDTTVDLKWDASTDNIGVVGYDIYQGTTKVGSASTLTYKVTGLTANTAYTFTVKARNAAGLISAPSNALTVTTNAASIAEWKANVAYKVNDLVTYAGKTYKCKQAHTSLPGWEPANVAALWALQ